MKVQPFDSENPRSRLARDLERPTVIGFTVYEFREVHLETAEAKKKKNVV